MRLLGSYDKNLYVIIEISHQIITKKNHEKQRLIDLLEKDPVLSKELDDKTFRNFYYLKEELVRFCRENGLPVSGEKIEIADKRVLFC